MQDIKQKTISEASAVQQHFKQFHHELYEEQYPSLTSFLEQNLLFITATFRQSQISIDTPTSIGNAHKTHPMSEFAKLYFVTIEKIMGNNLQRKRRWQPLTYAWVDFENSRSGHPIDPKLARNPHVHALALCHPAQRLRVQLELGNSTTRWQHVPKIESVRVDQYDSSKGSLYDLAEYCAKGYENIMLSDNDNTKIALRALLPK